MAIRRRAGKLLRPRNLAGGLAALALIGAGLALIPNAQAATSTSFERGPAPTAARIRAAQGPFAITKTTVARNSVSGFGGGDIFAPDDTSAGKFGAVAMAPGFTATRSSLAWPAPRIASQGFVVFNIDTLTSSDQPAQRGKERQADTVAPPAQHSIPFFNSMPAANDKGYLELTGASHFAPNIPDATISESSIAWLKRFVDNDPRFEQFLCPGPGVNATVSQYRADCPHQG